MLLCTNQNDRGEGVEQISCMGGIYGGAERVFIGLEEHADGSEIGIREILELREKLGRVG